MNRYLKKKKKKNKAKSYGIIITQFENCIVILSLVQTSFTALKPFVVSIPMTTEKIIENVNQMNYMT